MGKLNTAMRTFLCDRERFADLFNGVFFQGKPVIRADRLQEGSETYSDMTENPLDRARDLKMVTGDGETKNYYMRFCFGTLPTGPWMRKP